MPDYRATMMFQFDKSKPPAGFSETWEFRISSDEQAGIIAQQLVNERGKILSEDWAIIGIRLATLGLTAAPPTAIKQTYISIEQCIMNHEGELGSADMVQAAIRYKIDVFPHVTYPGARPKHWLIRGIPDDWWNAAEVALPKAADVKVNAFMGFLIANSFGHFVIDDLGALALVHYRHWCGPFPSNRKIGRPFGLLRGRRKCPKDVPVPPVP